MSMIFVIGGNSDIGYATTKVFAQNKYNIHLVSRNTSQLEIKKKEIENLYKVECKITCLDILIEDDVNNFFDHIILPLLISAFNINPSFDTRKINLFEITGRILVPNGISQLVFPEKESSDIVLCEELK